MKKIQYTLFYTFALVIFFSCQADKEKNNAEENSTVESSDLVSLSESQYKSVQVTMGKVNFKNMSNTLYVNGVLDVPPQNLISVSAIMGGFVQSTELLQGMQVSKGQVIASIQNPEFIQLQKEYLENKNKATFLEAEYKRQETLAKENVASAKTFQQVSADYHSLLANLASAEAQLKLIGLRPEQISYKHLKSTVHLYAPVSGYVTTVNINIGKYLQPQDIICEIVDTKHLHAELSVFEKDVSKLRKGQKIKFSLVNEPEKERTASIFLINRKINEDRTVRVHAHLDKEDTYLMPNMYLKATIELDSQSVSCLPDQAIVSAEDDFLIFVSQGKNKNGEYVFKSLKVEKGISRNGYTQVSLPEGFDANTPIVIQGAYELLSKLKNVEEEE